jgi:Fe2+ transport system protein FeoA
VDITNGAKVEIKGLAPPGYPVEKEVRGYQLTFPKDEASRIFEEIGDSGKECLRV